MSTINNMNGPQGINAAQGTEGIFSKDKGLSLADATMLVMMERADLLENQLRAQLENVHNKNQKLKQLSDIQAKLRHMENNTSNVNESSWTVDKTASPKVIQLDNGYTIEIEGSDQAWKIKDADGNETRIWGDPHVSEGDGTGTNWDFEADGTFILDDGTKIHVGTTVLDNGGVYTDTLTITKGNQSIEVTGISDNNPSIGEPGLNGAALDQSINDGHVFMMGDDVDDWVYQQGNGGEIGSDGWEVIGDDGVTADYEHTDSEAFDNINVVLNQDELALLDELGINVFDNSGKGNLNPDELKNLNTTISSHKDSLTSSSQLEMVKTQALNDKFNQTNSTLTNFLKSNSNQMREIARNLA